MLAGHPRLFAPPELELLAFDDMAERRAAFSGRDSFWLEGLIRAVMEVRGCGAEEAREVARARPSARDLTTRSSTAGSRAGSAARLLVDKTPSYALDRCCGGPRRSSRRLATSTCSAIRTA